MKSFNYTIQDDLGIHARPAGIMVKEVKKFASKITIEGNGKKADAGKLLAVMGMGIKKGRGPMKTRPPRRWKNSSRQTSNPAGGIRQWKNTRENRS